MDDFRRALYTQLAADVGVTALLQAGTGIFHRSAPLGSRPPYVIFHRQAGEDRYTFGTGPDARWEGQLWLVKAVDRAESATDAEDLADAIDDALHDANLPLDDHIILWCRRQSRVDYGADADDEHLHHVGGMYRLDAQPV